MLCLYTRVYCTTALVTSCYIYLQSELVPSSTTSGQSIKLGVINDLTDGTANVTQLIISALNAIAPTLTEDGEPLPGNIETTVETIATTPGRVQLLLFIE